MTTVAIPGALLVLFASSFGSENTPNISHVTVDRQKTLCGRKGWATEEESEADCQGDIEDWIGCLHCLGGYQKRKGRPVHAKAIRHSSSPPVKPGFVARCNCSTPTESEKPCDHERGCVRGAGLRRATGDFSSKPVPIRELTHEDQVAQTFVSRLFGAP